MNYFVQLTPGTRVGKNFPPISIPPYPTFIQPAGQVSDTAIVGASLLGLALQFGIVFGAAYYGTKAAIRRGK